VTVPVILVALAVSLLEPFACHVKIGADAVPEEATKCFEFWLNRYQTLIGGVLTLIAGSFAYFAAQKQIKHAENLQEKRRKAEEIAARAHLAFALDEINLYADKCLIKCADIYDMKGVSGTMDLKFPDLSANSIELMRNCIRFAPEESAKDIATLMNCLQIVKTRLFEMHISRTITDNEKSGLCHRILDLYVIKFLLDGLFNYSRFRENYYKKMAFYNYIKFQIGRSRFDPQNHPELFKVIEDSKSYGDSF